MADVVVVSGDITQRAGGRQFTAAGCFLDRLRPKALVVSRNHDIPLFDPGDASRRTYRGYERVSGGDLEPTFASEALVVVRRQHTRRGRHSDGEISAAQVERVARRFERRPRAAAPSRWWHHRWR